MTPPGNAQVFVHVGCGPMRQQHTTPEFARAHWREIRFDIDPSVRPDLEGSITDMQALASDSVDAVYSSHNIEHLYAHEVPQALAEFVRVLGPQGFAVITCPDLQSVCALVAQGQLTQTVYQSSAGPIAPLDILYGHRDALAAGHLHMAHRCGFTQEVLQAALLQAGFQRVGILVRQAPHFDLWAVATKSPADDARLFGLMRAHCPDLAVTDSSGQV